MSLILCVKLWTHGIIYILDFQFLIQTHFILNVYLTTVSFSCASVYIHVQPACWYLGDRDHLLALWCIYSLYLPSLSIRDIIHALMISLPIWDTINVLQNAVFPYHCITHFVSLQHKQIVQFFKYTTVERMNITRLTSTKFIFIHFCHANLRVWGENIYKEL